MQSTDDDTTTTVDNIILLEIESMTYNIFITNV
jgi:hypothetical protein